MNDGHAPCVGGLGIAGADKSLFDRQLQRGGIDARAPCGDRHGRLTLRPEGAGLRVGPRRGDCRGAGRRTLQHATPVRQQHGPAGEQTGEPGGDGAGIFIDRHADQSQHRAGGQHVVGQQLLPRAPGHKSGRTDALGGHAGRMARYAKVEQGPDDQCHQCQ